MSATRGLMTIDVVGAGPAYTDRVGAAGACYLVRMDGTSIVLDLGQGAFPRLASMIEPSTIDAVFVSHLHPDHFVDLVSLRHYLRWQFRPSRRVRVVGPAGLEGRLDALHDEPGFAAAALDVATLGEGSWAFGPLTVTAAKVTHTADSYAFRVASDRRPALVYSGDCGRADDLARLVRTGDTLLSEVSFGPGPVPADVAHLDGPAVGALAESTGVGAVLLTHLQMGFDERPTIESVRGRYSGPVNLVGPGDRYTI